jgi:hypothetical protein
MLSVGGSRVSAASDLFKRQLVRKQRLTKVQITTRGTRSFKQDAQHQRADTLEAGFLLQSRPLLLTLPLFAAGSAHAVCQCCPQFRSAAHMSCCSLQAEQTLQAESTEQFSSIASTLFAASFAVWTLLFVCRFLMTMQVGSLGLTLHFPGNVMACHPCACRFPLLDRRKQELPWAIFSSIDPLLEPARKFFPPVCWLHRCFH